jgi:hypothetical protein
MLLKPKLGIPVPSCRNMEITLNLVPFQAPKYATRIRLLPPPELRRLLKLPPAFSHMAQHMTYTLVFFLSGSSLFIFFMQGFVCTTASSPLVAKFFGPQLPVRVVLGEQVACQDTIHGCILDINVEVGTSHGNNYVEIEL